MVENGVSSFCRTSPRSPSKRRVFTKHRVVQHDIYIYNLCSREKVIFPPVLISGWQDRLATIIDAQRKKIIPMTGSINRVHIHGLLPSLPPPRLPSLSPSLLENEQASFDLCNFNPIGCSIEHKREEALGRGP